LGEQQHPRRRLHLRRNPTRPRTATRSEDLHLEGKCQHHAWVISARASSRNPAQADGRTGRSVASASCPPRTSARLMASATRLRRWSRQWTTRPGSGRRCYASSAWEVPCAWADEVSSPADSASVHADTAASGSGHRRATEGSLTGQEKPRAARPTEPRDSYASGIWIPHSSPSARGNSHLVKRSS
jgi:hypothetical protein